VLSMAAEATHVQSSEREAAVEFLGTMSGEGREP
ncbi:MAG: hypothetical protein AVDCRST_MAG93-5891, partial [uncultured Chloroflexia bacterium]